jgi:hypothetical protein
METSEEQINIKDYYEYIPHPETPEKGAVRIVFGPFTGLIYTYGDYKFSKVDEDTGAPSVRFSFNVLDIPEEMVGVEYPDEMKKSFSQLLGDILSDIVMDDVVKNVRVDYDNTNREGDIDESFERRVFYENSTPVLEE